MLTHMALPAAPFPPPGGEKKGACRRLMSCACRRTERAGAARPPLHLCLSRSALIRSLMYRPLFGIVDSQPAKSKSNLKAVCFCVRVPAAALTFLILFSSFSMSLYFYVVETLQQSCACYLRVDFSSLYTFVPEHHGQRFDFCPAV